MLPEWYVPSVQITDNTNIGKMRTLDLENSYVSI